MTRQIALGGEFKRRGLLAGRSYPEKLVLGVGTGIAVILAFIGTNNFFFLVAAVALCVFSVVITIPRNINGGRSVVALKAESFYGRFRGMTDLLVFDPIVEQQAISDLATYKAARTKKQKAKKPEGMAARRAEHRRVGACPAPLMVGRVSVNQVAYSNRENIAIFRHANSDPTFYTVIFEVRGLDGGLVEELVEDIPHIGFGKTLGRGARRTSAVSHIQSFTRSIPLDITDHITWLADYIDPAANDALVRSYQELCLQVEDRAEQHRSYLVLRFDNESALHRATMAHSRSSTPTYDAIVQEAKSLMSQAKSYKAISSYRPLDAVMSTAVLAHLQDPYSFSIDDADVAIQDVWQKLDQSKTRQAVVVNDRAYTRVAYIPRDGFVAGTALPVQSMRQLVSGIVPAVIHSVSWINELVDAKQARAEALSDRTSDKAQKHASDNKGKLSDGTTEVLSSSSDQRAKDLLPGSGNHGVKWGAYLSFTVASEEDLLAVSTQIEAVATDCGIDRLYWLDGRHDLALMSVLPMGRGIRK